MGEERIFSNDKGSTVSREKLYEEVWDEPMTKVALRYKVSGSFLARICIRLNVPRPPRGYWAMLAARKKIPRLPLSKAQPGDELEWARFGHARVAQLPLPSPTRDDIKNPHRRRVLPERHPINTSVSEQLSLTNFRI
jgi:hypothetical protein